MGQYQQWLHHREADRQLRAQLGALETELTQLQGQARLVGAAFEADQSLTSNAIIRALAIHLNEQTIANSDAAATSTATASHGSTETISPALLSWIYSQKTWQPFLMNIARLSRNLNSPGGYATSSSLLARAIAMVP